MTVSQIKEALSQLKAHIVGARNMGVSEEQLQGIVVALAANGLLSEAGRLAKALRDAALSDPHPRTTGRHKRMARTG